MRGRRWIIGSLASATIVFSSLSGANVRHTIVADVEAVLAEPVVVRTRIGRDFTGEAVQVTDNEIVLRTEVGDGSVEYTFAHAEIVTVRLPGTNLKAHALDLIAGSDPDAGLDLMDQLFRQRSPFFAYLSEAEPRFFAEAVPLYRANQRIADALARAEALLPFLGGDERAEDLLRDEILLAHFMLGHRKQAGDLAQSWIAEQPREAFSALGWYVRGSLAADEDLQEEAFFTYLRPIVFSGSAEVPYLDSCYAGAVRSAIALERWSAARNLLAEMQTRRIAWPDNLPPPDLSRDPAGTTAPASSNPLIE